MPDASALPTDLLHWLLAALPIIILFVLLIGLNWEGSQVAPVGMFSVALVAYFFFRTSAFDLAVASGKGVWDAVFILYVVWPALLFYRVIDAAGGFASLRATVVRFSRSELFLVLAFGWGFVSFLQGVVGFGVPLAIVAPILVAFAVRPVFAVALPLIGHVWGKMFGTLAEGWLVTTQVVELEDATATAFQSALLIWIPNLMAGLVIAWFFGRMPAVRYMLPLILIVSAIHGGVQAGMMFINPVLSNLVAVTLGLVAFIPLARWRYTEPAPADVVPERFIMEPDDEPGVGEDERAQGPDPVVSPLMSFFPYVLLTILAIAGVAIDPIARFLGQVTVGFPFPAIETGYGVAHEATAAYSPIAVLTHPGTFILIAAVVTWLVYRSRGYYEEWAKRANPQGIISGVVTNAIPSSVTILGFLVMSRIMDQSGQTQMLALGIAAVAPGLVYAFLANWIGLLGAFITGSSTASQALFSPLQSSVAATAGLPQSAVIAAQSAGGCIGNTLAPANLALGTSTVGISGREGSVLRQVLPWTLITATLIGIGTIVLSIVL